jgi:hypothetical protein
MYACMHIIFLVCTTLLVSAKLVLNCRRKACIMSLLRPSPFFVATLLSKNVNCTLCVCVRTYVCVCMHVCMCVLLLPSYPRTWTAHYYVCVCMYVCMYVCFVAHTHTHTHAHTHLHTIPDKSYAYANTHTHTHTHTHLHNSFAWKLPSVLFFKIKAVDVDGRARLTSLWVGRDKGYTLLEVPCPFYLESDLCMHACVYVCMYVYVCHICLSWPDIHPSQYAYMCICVIHADIHPSRSPLSLLSLEVDMCLYVCVYQIEDDTVAVWLR